MLSCSHFSLRSSLELIFIHLAIELLLCLALAEEKAAALDRRIRGIRTIFEELVVFSFPKVVTSDAYFGAKDQWILVLNQGRAPFLNISLFWGNPI